MRYQDLIDQVVHTSGESGSADYLADALRWLNLTRAEIADATLWVSALRPSAEITTSSRTDGTFSIGSTYEYIASSWMYDETNAAVLRCEPLTVLEGMDPEREVTGPPTLWADAGLSTAGVRQVRFYPRPDSVFTIRFEAVLRLTDVTAADLNDTSDDYFGVILPWSATFAAGMRYYKELDDNEDVASTGRAYGVFQSLVRKRMSKNTIAPRQIMKASVTKSSGPTTFGRLDPAHFSNG